MEPTPLQSRPADQRMTQGHLEDWPETAPKSPTVAIPSFEIRSTDPDPIGGPHPEGIPNSKPKCASFQSSAQKSATRPEPGDPIVKARHQPLGKVRKESPFRSRTERNSTRQGDPIAKTPTKHQEGGGRDFVRSRTDTDSTRKGDPIVKT